MVDYLCFVCFLIKKRGFALSVLKKVLYLHQLKIKEMINIKYDVFFRDRFDF